jgi:peptidoglycan/LPS O-acetylase OafA/YrhL
MVVIFHLHPSALPGGYVGVDVFFVISGFLITAHLLGRPPTSPADLASFWGRRIRRLLPASLLVLAATLAAVRLVAPATEWEPDAHEARAAALYVVNWSLARQAVDYLAQDALPTAVQHYWSLSVEEQFYFVWPLLIGLVVLVARRLRVPMGAALAVALGSVVALSFAYSISRTASDPAAAYFVTPTRIWELGCGGLLALAVSRARPRTTQPTLSRAARTAGSWIGLAMIVAAGVLYSGATAFPGYQAALPVLGAVLVILCSPQRNDRGTPGPFLALPPVRWLGDVSYSVYLWHWPLIVLAGYAIGHELRPTGIVAVLALTLVLAALTERFVERPFRSPRIARHELRTYVLAGAAMTVVVAAATAQIRDVQQLDQQARVALAHALHDGGRCFGAPALDPGQVCKPVAYHDLLPTPVLAPDDRSAAYQDVGGRQCWSYPPSFPTRTCAFGERRSDVTIALVGNSHAGQWLPAMQVLAREHGWRVETYLASQCASSDVLQRFRTEAGSAACRQWVRRTAEDVARAKPALVVMSNRISVTAVGHDLEGSQPVYADGYTRVLDTLLGADIPVLAIRDTPAPGIQVPTCIAEHGDDYEACDGTREGWLPADPVVGVIEGLHDERARVVDLTDHICGPTACRAVNGGVITYFDTTHLTATYVHTLAPYLEPSVLAMLERKETT